MKEPKDGPTLWRILTCIHVTWALRWGLLLGFTHVKLHKLVFSVCKGDFRKKVIHV